MPTIIDETDEKYDYSLHIPVLRSDRVYTDIEGASLEKKKSGGGARPALEPAKQVLWSRPGFLVRRLHQIHGALFFEECSSVTPVQYGVLTAVSLAPGIDQTAIGMELGLDRTTTADVVTRLEQKGYLVRKVNPADRRARQSFITPAGLRLMGELQEGMERSQLRMIAPLGKRDREVFMKLLFRLVEANNHYGRAAAKDL